MKYMQYTDEQIVNMIRGESRERETAVRILMDEEFRTRRLIKQILHLGGTSEECEEIVNDAFVALITGITSGRFQSGSSIWGYLYGAARHILWKMHRGQKHATFVGLENIREEGEESVETHIIGDERRSWLLSVFRQLSDKCQKILHLAFFRELTNDEIAVQLGYKSREVVGVKKSECLKGLARLLKQAQTVG